jgi:hypothetical protein
VLTVVPSLGFGALDPALQSMLEAQGFVFSEVVPTTELTPALLSGVDILFLKETPLVNDPLLSSEVAALQSFVGGGGGLLIVGEAGPDYGPSNLASRAAPFGVGVDTVGVYGIATDFTPHPLTVGLSSLAVFGGETLTVTSPGLSVVRLPDGGTVIAAAEVGLGHVVVSGDEVWGSHDFGNPTFTSNVFNWLVPPVSAPDPASHQLQPIGAAALGWMRKRWASHDSQDLR